MIIHHSVNEDIREYPTVKWTRHFLDKVGAPDNATLEMKYMPASEKVRVKVTWTEIK